MVSRCGLSDRQAPDISFGGFVRDLETVVDTLALERFALFGTSQSAAVSIAYAARPVVFKGPSMRPSADPITGEGVYGAGSGCAGVESSGSNK